MPYRLLQFNVNGTLRSSYFIRCARSSHTCFWESRLQVFLRGWTYSTLCQFVRWTIVHIWHLSASSSFFTLYEAYMGLVLIYEVDETKVHYIITHSDLVLSLSISSMVIASHQLVGAFWRKNMSAFRDCLEPTEVLPCPCGNNTIMGRLGKFVWFKCWNTHFYKTTSTSN